MGCTNSKEVVAGDAATAALLNHDGCDDSGIISRHSISKNGMRQPSSKHLSTQPPSTSVGVRERIDSWGATAPSATSDNHLNHMAHIKHPLAGDTAASVVATTATTTSSSGSELFPNDPASVAATSSDATHLQTRKSAATSASVA